MLPTTTKGLSCALPSCVPGVLATNISKVCKASIHSKAFNTNLQRMIQTKSPSSTQHDAESLDGAH
jgi:hypothetical protein